MFPILIRVKQEAEPTVDDTRVREIQARHFSRKYTTTSPQFSWYSGIQFQQCLTLDEPISIVTFSSHLFPFKSAQILMLSFQFLSLMTGDFLYCSYLPVVQRLPLLFLPFQSVWLNHFTLFCSPGTRHSYKITSSCNERVVLSAIWLYRIKAIQNVWTVL